MVNYALITGTFRLIGSVIRYVLGSYTFSEFEVDLSQDKNDFKTCPPNMRDIMLKNLAFQFELDSCASRATGSLIAPFVTNPELWRCAIKIQEIELLHAVTYSHIARMCLEEPNELIDEAYKNEAIIDRATKIIDVFSEIQKLGALYTISPKSVDIKELKKAFYRLAQKIHPDKFEHLAKGKQTEILIVDNFRRVQSAYEFIEAKLKE